MTNAHTAPKTPSSNHRLFRPCSSAFSDAETSGWLVTCRSRRCRRLIYGTFPFGARFAIGSIIRCHPFVDKTERIQKLSKENPVSLSANSGAPQVGLERD